MELRVKYSYRQQSTLCEVGIKWGILDFKHKIHIWTLNTSYIFGCCFFVCLFPIFTTKAKDRTLPITTDKFNINHQTKVLFVFQMNRKNIHESWDRLKYNPRWKLLNYLNFCTANTLNIQCISPHINICFAYILLIEF